MDATMLTPRGFAQQFDEKRGGADKAVVYQGVMYFPCGSWRDCDPRGVSADASRLNEGDRARSIVKFHWIRHQISLEQFKQLRQRLLGVPFPDKKGLAELETLAEEVRRRGAELDAVSEEHAKHLPGYIPPEQRIAEAERAQQLDDFRNKVKDVEI